jgi:hypothetical protein
MKKPDVIIGILALLAGGFAYYLYTKRRKPWEKDRSPVSE